MVVTGAPEVPGGEAHLVDGLDRGVGHAPGAVGSTVLPDLRRAGSLESAQAWNAVVEGGALKDNGMASFKGSLSKDEIEAIRAYVIKRANEDKALEVGKKIARR